MLISRPSWLLESFAIFSNIHQCVKSFDKHGDLSAFFSII